MKKILCVLVALLFLFSTAAAHAATSEDLMTGMGHKLWRGVVNTLTGWIELPAQIVKGYNRGLSGDGKNQAAGAFVGIFTGTWYAAGRTVSGAGDIAGFWAADPTSNEGVGIPLDAEYAWEEGTAYDMWKPNFSEGAVTPIGNKLGRGLGNGFGGFLEFPGQIVKGIKLKAPDLGLVKSLWYWYSREIDGCYDIVTFLLPNPKDTKALPFDEKWPWSALGDSVK